MSILTRKRYKLPHSGPWLGIVTNHLDPTYMGGLEVSLVKGTMGELNLQNETLIVRQMTPFYGITPISAEGTNSADFNDVQKSYGMWFVPPDLGTTVMCIFIDGDPNQGYWMGCVPEPFQNHMIPGIAASQSVAITPEQERKYGTRNLPVAEFLKKGRDLSIGKPNSFTKPIHPFADRLLAQGLLTDTIRGVTSSSARREVPSTVFGISTPGPLDPNGKKGYIGYEGVATAPVSRLGGSSFVMDDGDKDGQNELVRIRTRTGHQILLHNSQDLIYIANAKGTAWIEMTSNGKLDIYAQDSVSIHTEADFNFRADRDINLEAGRNINIRALGNMEQNITGHYFLTVDDNAKISIAKTKDETVGMSSKLTVVADLDIAVNQNVKISADSSMNLFSGSSMKQQSGADFNVRASGLYKETAAEIHMNGPSASSATRADSATIPPDLPLYSLPNRQKSAGWEEGQFYKAGNLSSIMQRVPTHEPWDQHENINPQQFSAAATDSSLQSRAGSGLADSPNAATQTPANSPDVIPGTCDPALSKEIGAVSSQAGIAELKEACAKLGLTSPYAVSSLLGIVGGESRWKSISENLSYKSVDRLLQVFASRFKGDKDLAAQYVNNPTKLANFVYGPSDPIGRQLGNTEEGDGAKFIGRGYIQITGRANYARYGKLLADAGYVSSADALTTNPELALTDTKLSAALCVLYFKDRVKTSQDDPGYFEKACKAVGFNTPDIKAKKKGFYSCFLAQLQGKIVTTGSGVPLTDSSGNPVRTGIK